MTPMDTNSPWVSSCTYGGGSLDPTEHVVADGRSGTGGTGQTSGLDDGASSSLNGGDEVVGDPVLVGDEVSNVLLDASFGQLGDPDERVLSLGVVSPDDEVSEVGHVATQPLADLAEGSVLIESMVSK